MRDIKFRAWIKKEYDQCGGFMLYDPDEESTDYFMVSNGRGFAVVYDDQWLKESDYEIMQYTGLKDKNGKEIYEGDICLIDWRDNRYKTQKASVIWDDNQAAWDFGPGSTSEVSWSHEVIGNIYKNPELLEE